MQRCLTVGAQVTLIQVNSSTRIPRSLPASFLFVPIRYRFQVSLFKPLKPLTPNQLSRGSPPGTATLRPPSSLSLSLSLSLRLSHSLTLSLSLSLVGLLQVPRRCARHLLSLSLSLSVSLSLTLSHTLSLSWVSSRYRDAAPAILSLLERRAAAAAAAVASLDNRVAAAGDVAAQVPHTPCSLTHANSFTSLRVTHTSTPI
jgi:hypothetical protein